MEGDAQTASRRKGCRVLSTRLLALALKTPDPAWLASPVTGGGVEVGYTTMLLLEGWQRGLREPDALAREAQATLAECLEDKKNFAKARDAWKRAVEAPGALPEWHFRYGRLLADEHKAKDALEHVVYAASEGAKRQGKPGWLQQANFLAGELLVAGKREAEARPYLERFLETAGRTDPDRSAAQKMLAGMR